MGCGSVIRVIWRNVEASVPARNMIRCTTVCQTKTFRAGRINGKSLVLGPYP